MPVAVLVTLKETPPRMWRKLTVQLAGWSRLRNTSTYVEKTAFLHFRGGDV